MVSNNAVLSAGFSCWVSVKNGGNTSLAGCMYGQSVQHSDRVATRSLVLLLRYKAAGQQLIVRPGLGREGHETGPSRGVIASRVDPVQPLQGLSTAGLPKGLTSIYDMARAGMHNVHTAAAVYVHEVPDTQV